MSIRTAAKELQKRQGALDVLNDEKKKILEAIEALQKERNNSVRLLAGGDERMRRTIMKTERKIQLQKLDMEALETRIAEAEEKVTGAAEELREARAQKDRERAAYTAERERERLAKLRASAGERKQDLKDSYAAFIEKLGLIYADSVQWVDGRQLIIEELSDITNHGFLIALSDSLREKGLKPLTLPGYTGQINIHAHIALDEELAAAFPGKKDLNVLEISQAMHKKRISDFEREFEDREE